MISTITWPTRAMLAAVLPRTRSTCLLASPQLYLARERDSIHTFILGFGNAFRATYQAELGCAARRLAQVVYLGHAAALGQASLLLFLHAAGLAIPVCQALGRSVSGSFAGNFS